MDSYSSYFLRKWTQQPHLEFVHNPPLFARITATLYTSTYDEMKINWDFEVVWESFSAQCIRTAISVLFIRIKKVKSIDLVEPFFNRTSVKNINDSHKKKDAVIDEII